MRKFTFCIFIFSGMVAFREAQPDIPKSAWKKVEKEWSRHWPDKAIEKEQISVLNGQSKLEYSLYRLSVESEMKGYMMISKGFGRYDYFDYMVIYDLDLSIKSASILIYREDWGGEIASKRWLKQFIGLSSNDDMRLDHDIQGISGATISCRSAISGVKEVTDELKHLSDNGDL